MATPHPIRVGIVEDQATVREALARLLSTAEGFALMGEFGSIEAAATTLPGAMPDVLLVDLGLPGMSGTEGIRLFHQRWPNLVLLVLTIHEENQYIFEALCAGADGYLLKSTPPENLLRSLSDAVAGGAPISPSIATKVIRFFREVRPQAAAGSDLTPHEFRILKLLANGENYKTSAAMLNVSVNTISFHVRSIYAKLEVHSRSEAVAAALRRGLIR